jgi:hypothetical protein
MSPTKDNRNISDFTKEAGKDVTDTYANVLIFFSILMHAYKIILIMMSLFTLMEFKYICRP